MLIGGDVHLTKIDRAAGTEAKNVHAAEKHLSRYLGSQPWSMEVLADCFLHRSAGVEARIP